MDIQTIAEKAADWWVDAISSGRRGSAGDGMIDMLHGLATGGRGPMGDVDRFRNALIRDVVAALHQRDSVFLSTDYGPDGQLADVARKVGLRANFPMKTLMRVDRDDGVTVSCGYRAPTVRVCGNAIWTARLYRRDFGGTLTAYRGTVESEARTMYTAALDALAAVGRGAVTLERDGYAVESRRA